jgi:hypothetical protein
MTITEFHQAVMTALAVEPDKGILQDLAGEAHQLADMVGWADDTIDKDNRVSDAFIDLQSRAKTYYEACKHEDVAILHDAIGDLMNAIIRHDDDLTPSTDGDEDSGVL